MANWVIEGILATSPRPGYRPGFETTVPKDTVDQWVVEKREFGIRSIICLLDRDQLPLYERHLPAGLIAHYVASGFDVGHVPTFDGQTNPFTPDQYEEIWQTYLSLPKPVLVHCSAGHDRTYRAIDYILERIQALGGD
ncbi:MAG: hypothetical protein WEC33_05800 [Dehalococcoidia bacterium]